MDTKRRSGSCLCGAVRYSVLGEPLRVGLCHCLDCRKTSGSAFTMFAIWPRSAYAGSGALAAHGGRSFCPACGSRVVSLSDTEAEILVGSLDEAPSDFWPSYELWVGRREHWLAPVPGTAQFPRDRNEDL